jgi:endonuclease/exonuclease/phosphatase family metal-dependent hydrolase
MRLRVVDYNVRSFRAGVDKAIEAIGEPPDLVLVQECGPRRLVRRFAGALGLRSVSSHRLFRPVRNAVLHGPEWRVACVTVANLSRQGRTALRGFVAVQLRHGAVALTAVSAHLGLAPRERELHARELTDWMAGRHGPLVLGADLNEGPDEPAARWMGGRLYDGFTVAGRGGGYTFPARVPTARIDYVFVGQGVQVVGCWVEGSESAARGSDHRPVVAELEIPETSGM